MSERLLRITESVITVALTTAVALFAIGFIAGQQIERHTNAGGFENGFVAGCDYVGRQRGTQPMQTMPQPGMGAEQTRPVQGLGRSANKPSSP